MIGYWRIQVTFIVRPLPETHRPDIVGRGTRRSPKIIRVSTPWQQWKRNIAPVATIPMQNHLHTKSPDIIRRNSLNRIKSCRAGVRYDRPGRAIPVQRKGAADLSSLTGLIPADRPNDVCRNCRDRIQVVAVVGARTGA